MQFTSILALAPLALAAPLTSRQDYTTFSVLSARSASPVHLQNWAARNSNIYISGDSATYCPEIEGLDCSQYKNGTAFVAPTGNNVGLGLDTTVPGGQQVFVRKDGSLGYTLPHSASIPEGASLDGFVNTAPAQGAQFGDLSYAANGANGFVACPVSEGGYQVFANVEGSNTANCLGFDALTPPFQGSSAWEYTG